MEKAAPDVTQNKNKCNSCCSAVLNACWCCVKPITNQTLLHHYIPLLGAGCYGTLSLHVIKPSVLRSVLPRNDPTNILLASSLTGACFYVYSRKHLRQLSGGTKVGYSLFTSGMFNLGSLLLWAMIRSATSDKRFSQLRVILAIGSAWILTKVGVDYLDVIDGGIKDDSNKSLDKN